MITETQPRKVRTLFLSDLHLGSPHCKVERLLKFLSEIEFEELYLVGDIFDDPRIQLPIFHRGVVKKILERLTSGACVTFIPGNHDALLKGFFGVYGKLVVLPEAIHVTVKGETIFLIHGDELDRFFSGHWLHLIDRWLPIPFWEMIRRCSPGFMASHVKAFESRALKACPRHNYVLTGHVHSPVFKKNFLNTGDWVTHCSAIVERFDGTLELVYG
jgi:UDP-2,3-diacylglucosamine pyrophosphatase LpxH